MIASVEDGGHPTPSKLWEKDGYVMVALNLKFADVRLHGDWCQWWRVSGLMSAVGW
jgi:hypothetical protein